MMDDVRYVLALLAVITIPPAILYWFILHPFVEFWRRVGKLLTFLFLAFVYGAGAWGLWTVREPLLAVEYGTNRWLWIPAILTYGAVTWIQLRIRKQLRFRVLAGSPELDPDGKGGRLLQEGLYARVRHPRYAAVTLGVLAWAFFTNYLAVYLLVPLTALGLAGVAALEERELEERFGDAYRAYRERVPMIVPRWTGGAPAGEE